jgi:hypothetical protein
VLGLKRESFSHKLLQAAVTFCLVDFAWIFFRADTLAAAQTAVQNVFHANNPWIFLDGSLLNATDMSEQSFRALLLFIAVLFVADIAKYKGIRVRELLMKQEWWFRYLVCILGVIVVFVFGVYGYGYNEQSFIYFQF